MISRLSTGYFSWNILAWGVLFTLASLFIIVITITIIQKNGAIFFKVSSQEDDPSNGAAAVKNSPFSLIADIVSAGCDSWRGWAYFEIAELIIILALFIIAVLAC